MSALAVVLLVLCVPAARADLTHFLALTRLRAKIGNTLTLPVLSTASRARNNNVVTLTLVEAVRGRFSVGDPVNITGISGAGYNGVQTLTAVSDGTISYISGGADELTTADSGGAVSLAGPATASIAFFGDSYATGLIPLSLRQQLFTLYGFHGFWCGASSPFQLGGYGTNATSLSGMWIYHTNGYVWKLDTPGQYFKVGVDAGSINKATFVLVSPSGGSVKLQYQLQGQDWLDGDTITVPPGSTLSTASITTPVAAVTNKFRILYQSGVVITSGALAENTNATGLIQANLEAGGIDLVDTNTMPAANLAVLLNLIHPDLIMWDISDDGLGSKIAAMQTLWDQAYPTDWLFITPQPNVRDPNGGDAAITIAHALAHGQNFWSVLPQLPTFSFGVAQGWYQDMTHLNDAGSAALTPRLWDATGLLDTSPPPSGSLLTGAIIGTPSGDPSHAAKNTFDSDLTTYFVAPDANGAWVGIDLGTGNERALTAIRFCPQVGQAVRVVGGVFQGANTENFDDAVTLSTVTSLPWESAVYTTIAINNDSRFRYLRYMSPNGGFANIAEIQFYGAPTPTPTPAAILPPPPVIKGRMERRTAKSKITLSGTQGIEGAYIEYRIGKGAWIRANAMSNWKIHIRLKHGRNAIYVTSVDPLTGKRSLSKKIIITRV